MENKTTIKKIKEPDFSKEVVITQLSATKETVDYYFNQMKKALGDKVTETQIWQRINSLVLKDNVFNEAMKILVPCYEINLDPQQITSCMEFLKRTNPYLKNVPEESIRMLAITTLKKELVFGCIAKEEDIKVTDEETKSMLEMYYKASNQPIRDILANPQAMEGVKRTILEQKIGDIICKKLKWKADWDSIKKFADINNAKAAKDKEEKAKAEEKGDGTIIEN